MKRAVIRGVGSYLPKKVITNDDLSKTLDTSHEWIVERTGIIERHIAAASENTSDLAYEASLKALDNAGVQPQELDLIILATCTPDHTFPATAVLLQQRLEAVKACAFDISAVCSGFVVGLATVQAYIESGLYKKILLVGAETLSRIVDWEDRNTAVLFGDGSGAMVFDVLDTEGPKQGFDQGILKTVLCSDGCGYKDLRVSGGPCSSEYVGKILMNGRSVFKKAVVSLTDNALNVLKESGFEGQDIDWFVPHQANKRIIDAMVENLKVCPKKVVYTGQYHANTSAATIPLAFAHAVDRGMIQRGHVVLANSFGAGYIWGGAIFRY